MTEMFKIQQTGDGAIPFALIPSADIWSLMEYLSYQRMRVHYEPHAAFYKVSFPHIEAPVAQQFMDDWRASLTRRDLEPAAESAQ